MTEHVCEPCEMDFPNAGSLASHRHYQHENPAPRVSVTCAYCGTTDDILASQRNDDYEHWFCSMDCRDDYMREAFQGEGNPRYVGALTEYVCDHCDRVYEEYQSQVNGDYSFCHWDCYVAWQEENAVGGEVRYGAEWKAVREKIRQRDRVCANCEEEPSDGNHDVHHIVSVREFDDLSAAHDETNLVLLCRSCHANVEAGNIPCPTVFGCFT